MTKATSSAAAHRVPRRVHVLGAGIAGAAAAHLFARRGAQVSVIDPDSSRGASRIPAAVVRPRLWPGDAGPVPDAEILAAAFRWTVNWLRDLATPRFRGCGVLLVPTDAADEAKMRRRVQNPATADLARWLSADEARDTVGVEVPPSGGAWIARAGVLDLGGLVQDLLDDPRIEVRAETPTEAPTGSPDLRVLATAHADLLTATRRAVRPVRGQAIAGIWPASRPAPRAVLCGHGYLTPPTEDGRFWIGSTYDRDDACGDPRATDDDRIRALFANWPDLPQVLARVACAQRFAAVRSTTPDRLPLVGALPDGVDGVPTLASLAHGSRGAVTGPIGAAMLVAEACGEAGPLAPHHRDRLAPCRVRPGS